jgi:hypothetical protein
MRTKVLLSLAAFAVSAFAAYAQSNVYSVNVVGFVNRVLPAGTQVAVANPLDNGTNTLNDTFGALAKGSTANFWTGSGFSFASKGSAVWAPNNATPVGTGLFVNSKTPITNTFVGEVIVGPGESTTNALPLGAQVLVGSAIPYAGDLNTPAIGLLTLAKGSTANFWNGTGYTFSSKGSAIWAPALAINVSDGFFLNSKTATNWVQTLPAN